MTAKNYQKKYRLLVLSDLSKNSNAALLNAVKLAKVIDGEVEVFHAKAPADVVKQENQLSAMRTIHQDFNATKKSLQASLREIEQKEGMRIPFQISYGNIKSTILERIKEVNPDIVVLGKRKKNKLKILGDKITESVLNNSSASLLIAGNDDTFHSFSDISLGIFGQSLKESGLEIIQDLKRKNPKPLKMFSLDDQKSATETSPQIDEEERTISYVFSKANDNALNGLLSYVLKTNTQLLCVPAASKGRNTSKAMRRITQSLEIPILITR